MQARARAERGQLDGAMKDRLAAWTHEIRDTFCGGGRQRRKAIVDSLGTAIAGADAKVISRGVHYHHFHDSQRLLMLSPG